ncbi:MAG TPA: hypothetical protein EYH45_05455 [Candidatus Caldiarchaeum subterraneum]|uniref:Uncharacterized protein n=1 Tax=Caldiarchaeum subterraneum TaxID=311458 RepID=A0A832ZW67_CALS0|nr:hypothetical protein [Candidatus Caldarchaeum subterraneum]
MKPPEQRIRETWLKLAEDPVFNTLLRNSSITRRQMEVLLLDLTTQEQELKMSYEERARLLKLTKGAYARIRKQAIKNITEAMFTVILAAYLGMLKLPSINWILEIGELLHEGDVESLRNALNLLKTKEKK